MEEDIIRLYREAIALVSLRNNNISLFGDFEIDKDKTCFVLKWMDLDSGKLNKKRFRYAKDTTEALKFFIKYSQNLYRLR